MKKYLIVQLCLLFSGLALPFLFWGEGLGLNLFLLELLLLGGLFLNQQILFRESTAPFLIGAWALSILMYLLNHNGYALTVNIGSMLGLVGLAQYRTVRFIWAGLGLGLWSFGLGPHRYVSWMLEQHAGESRLSEIYRWLRLTILPGVVVFIFLILYCIASPRFGNLLFDTLDFLLSWTQLEGMTGRVFLFFFGAFLAIPFALQQKEKKAHRWEALQETLVRQPGNDSLWRTIWGIRGILALKKEYRMGIIVLSALNVLLLLVNGIDLTYVWLNFSEASAAELSQYVHAGTQVLIATILMAAALILYFFRANLNFYPDHKPLQLLATAWLAQNAWLALSVGMRNYRYIEAYGLTERRIGVFVFLLLTLIGLWAVFQKVHDRKTLAFVFNRTAWGMGIVFLLMGSFNWEVLVTKYNIHFPSREGVDAAYLVSQMSTDNLYVLWEEWEQLAELDPRLNRAQVVEILRYKNNRLQGKAQDYTWRSWNLPLARNRKYLVQQSPGE